MKIAFTCNNLNNGGAERVVTNLSNAMVLNNFEVDIICYKVLEGFSYPIHPKVNIVQLDEMVYDRHSFFKRKFAGAQNILRLVKALKNVDIVVSFYSRQNCYSILACKILNIPIICAERDHFFLNDGWFNFCLRRIFYPMADGFIHQTEDMKNEILKRTKARKPGIVIPNPLWMRSFPERNPQRNEICAVGRLANQKNYDGIIRSFAHVLTYCPDSTLHIYGEGPDKEHLLNMIQELNLEGKVILEGFCADIQKIYIRSDVFIMFSKGEGYPNALMEALAMGMPVVVSDCPIGGPKDMIQNGVNGFLVPNNDEKAFAKRIIELLSDLKLKEKFSNNAKMIRKTNEFSVVYAQWVGYIKKILDEWKR